MTRGPVTIILVVALAVVWASFFALGFGTGALSTAAPATTQTSMVYDGISISVSFNGGDSLGYFTSAYNPNGSSTPIGFNVIATPVPGTCANPGGWGVGQGADYGWYEVFVTNGATGARESLDNNPSLFSLVYSQNNSQPTSAAWCYYNGAGGIQSAGNAAFFSHTITLTGQYEDFSILHVQFYTEIRGCSLYSNGGLATYNQCQFAGHSFGRGPGTSQGNAEGQAILRSGYSQLTPPTTTPVNGGSFGVGYSTGYNQGAGWLLTFNSPSARGTPHVVSSQNLPSDQVGTATIQVPVNASQTPPTPCANLNQYCLWNLYSVTLFSNSFPTATLATIQVNIGPASGPMNVGILFSDPKATGGTSHPGDQVTLQFSARSSNNSGPVTGFLVQAWYAGGTGTPPTSSQFYALGTPNGPVQVQVGPGNTAQWGGGTPCSQPGCWYIGNATFTVSQNSSVTVTALAVSASAQGSNPGSLTIEVTPPNPNCMGSCGVTTSPLWALLGPVLLSAGIILAGVTVAVFPPSLPTWTRVVAVAVGVGLVIVLVVVSFGGLFGPGVI